MNSQKFQLPAKFKFCEQNVWMEYSDLARKYKPLNLGQGAPDYGAPKVLSDTLIEISKEGQNPQLHQYARGYGHPRLVNVLSKLYSPMINHELSPTDEILITNGATEALYCAVLGLIDDGDEVIIMEPYFDHYEYIIKMAGGIPRYIPLKPKENMNTSLSRDWTFDKTILEEIFNEKTKIIIVNSPHNPTGKVFTLNELEIIADLCKRWDVVCVFDEVYEWMVYESCKHERIVTLPGMWERTISVGSAGKTFSATGWKIGWAYGPSDFLKPLRVIHQNCVYTCCTPLQEGIARAFEKEIENFDNENSYLNTLSKSLTQKRNFMAKILTDNKMKPVLPDGGYFMVADWTLLESKANLDSEYDKYKDYRFTKWMIKNIGLQVIPLSAFYSEENKYLGENFVRFCFIKENGNLEKAETILKSWLK